MPWLIEDYKGDVVESFMDGHAWMAFRKLQRPEYADKVLKYSPITYKLMGVTSGHHSNLPAGTVEEMATYTCEDAAIAALESYRKRGENPGQEVWFFWYEEVNGG